MLRALAVAAFTIAPGLALAQAANPARAAVDALLATDRRYSELAAGRTVVDAWGEMFSNDVSMQAPSGFIDGREAVLAALRANPLNTGTARWTPVRAGISADGTQGFTFGYMTLQRGDSAVPLKYMSWWTRRAEGWQVTVFKWSPASGPPASVRPMEPSLPAVWGRVLPNAAGAAEDLRRAEGAFSDLAARAGLREAFLRTGTPDAVNMGGGGSASFVIGAEAISQSVSEGVLPGPSALTWGADRVIVAASGDLGISIGTIVAPGPTAGAPGRRIPFFTIWRRDSATAPWRYIAE